MDAVSRRFRWINLVGVATALAGSVTTAADSVTCHGTSQQSSPEPIAYTSIYCYDFDCTLYANAVVTPFGQTAGPGDSSPSWSPDGSQLAIASNGDIVIINAAATSAINITNTAESEWSPEWSPSGQHVAFLSNREGQVDLYVMNPDGSNVVRLTANAGIYSGQLTWAPDSERLAYSCMIESNNWDICAIGIDGSGFARLTNYPGFDGFAAWSPDGGTILYSTMQFTSSYEVLALMNPDGSGATRLGQGIIGWEGAWSSDGYHIAFSSYDNGNLGVGIFTMRADGTDIRLVAQDAVAPAWSPFASIFSASCVNLTCTFDATSSVGAIDTYAWGFGDGTSGNGRVASHTYTQGGPYVITLTVANASGATATSQLNILVNHPPVASFSVTCDRALTCRFEPSASDSDGWIASMEWTFGDGTSQSCCISSAQHNYAGPGTYTATLRVTDDQLASTTVSHTFIVDTPLMHVGDLEGTSANTQGTWMATVTIYVHNANHSSINGAAVTAEWDDGTPASCTTGLQNRCTVSRSNKAPIRSVALTVTGVSHPVFAYSPSLNHDRDGDSTGTAITVRR